jgi:hypothetical protein
MTAMRVMMSKLKLTVNERRGEIPFRQGVICHQSRSIARLCMLILVITRSARDTATGNVKRGREGVP